LLLDRDGVINYLIPRAGIQTSPRSIDEFSFLGDFVQFMSRCELLDLRIFVITNQPDLSRGLIELSALESIHNYISASFPRVEKFYTCPHTSNQNCLCRKPKPGLVEQCLLEHDLKPSQTLVVGDSWVDIMAGRGAGCSTALLERPYSWDARSQGNPPADLSPDFKFATLLALMDSALQ
jgi:D-glycero-D-manno-heptose 1,7-bisphosphate phosphatase